MFGLGLLSGAHCLQMCGAIVLAYSMGAGRSLRVHLTYNAGRILTYMALGAVAGAAGSGIGLLGRLAGFATGARIFSGAAMIAAGILMIGFIPSSGLVHIQKHGITSRFAKSIGRMLLVPGSKFGLGLTLGFLPCGLIYAALLKAMESASPAAGALTMLAFGLGTAVSLLAVGVAGSFAGLRPGRWSNRLAAVGIMIAGAVLLWRGLGGPRCHG
jgi:sulfite exporter TauE/SafE